MENKVITEQDFKNLEESLNNEKPEKEVDIYKECDVENQMGVHFSSPFDDAEGKNYEPWQLFLRYDDVPVGENEYERHYELSLYIYNEIVDSERYITLFQILKRYLAIAGTTLTINIDSVGGDLFTLMNLVNIIENANADTKVITVVDGQACSAGFVLACIGDEIRIGEYAILMAHSLHSTVSNREMTSMNKSNIVIQNVYKKLLLTYGIKFLTEEEIANITENGAEIWIESDEANQRLVNWLNRYND